MAGHSPGQAAVFGGLNLGERSEDYTYKTKVHKITPRNTHSTIDGRLEIRETGFFFVTVKSF